MTKAITNALIQLNGVNAQLILQREQIQSLIDKCDQDNENEYIPLANQFIDIDASIEILTDAIEQIKSYK